MTAKTPRWSRKRAVAEAFGQDMADVEEYQPGQTALKIFQMGSGYAIALRKYEVFPKGFGPWSFRSDEGSYKVFYTTGEAE